MTDLDPAPGTLEELLAWVRARAQENDVALPEVLGVFLDGPDFQLAQRDGMATAFREMEHLLVVLLERFGRTEESPGD